MRSVPSKAAIALLSILLAVPLVANIVPAEDVPGLSATLTLDGATSTQTVDISAGSALALFSGHVEMTKQTVARETVRVSLTGTAWDWELTPETHEMVLPSDGFDIQGRLTVPAATSEGTYTVTVEVSWVGIDGLVRLDTGTLTIDVLHIPFTLEVYPTTAQVTGGGTATFWLTVRAGPALTAPLECLAEDVSSTVQAPWLRSVYPLLDVARLELPPGGAETFALEVDVPLNATDALLTVPVRVWVEGYPDYAREQTVTLDVQGLPVAKPSGPSWLEHFMGDRWLQLAIVSLALVVGVVAILGGTEVGLLSLLFLLLPLFTRLRHREVLNQFTRGEIYGFIKANPGASLTAVRENLELSNGVVAYHLRVLLREEYIVARREGGYKRFYPVDIQVPRKRVHFTRLQIDIAEKAGMHPGISQSSLARMLGESKQVVSYNLKVLIAAGVVRVEREGSKTLVFPVEGANVLAEEETPAAAEALEAEAPEEPRMPQAPSPVRLQ
jgi:predicted transcriptional regulator